MNILMLTDRLALGGAETHIFELSRILRKRGHSVSLASAGGEAAALFHRAGIPLYTLPLARRDPLSLARATPGLFRLLRQGHFDLVHGHARLPNALAAPLCRRLGIPFVTTAHWVFSTQGLRGRMSAWGDAVIAVSEDIRQYLSDSYGIDRDRVFLVPNGIDTERFCPPSLPKEGGRLIHVSRLDEGRAACARALLRIAPQLAGAAESLTVVGDGNAFAELAQQAREVNEGLGRPFVHLLGARTDVADLLRKADIFIGVSRAALEAMACGCAVVAAGDEGCLSVLDEERLPRAAEGNFCCRGAPPLRDGALLAAIKELLGDRTRQKKASEAGLSYVRKHFSAEKMADATEAAYRSLGVGKRTHGAVALCGYYGAGNLGDDAALSGILAGLRRDAFSPLTLITNRPRETARRFGTRAVSRKDLSAIEHTLYAADLFLLGGGNLLQNETSDRSLFYYTHLVHMAKRAGCRIILRGGIGPLYTPKARRRAARALREADLCFLRTPADISRARDLLGGEAPKALSLLPDEALYLTPASPARMALCGLREDGQRYLVLALRGGRMAPDSLARLCRACGKIAAQHGLCPVTVAMHPTQDERTAREAAALMGGRYQEPLSPAETVAFFKRASLVVSDRLHALIFAIVAGCAALTAADGGKIDDLSAFVTACEGERPSESSPLLTLLRGTLALATADDTFIQTANRLLAMPPDPTYAAATLACLRQKGNGFSYAAALESVTPK